MLSHDQPRRWLAAASFMVGFLSLANPWPASSALPLREAIVLCLAAAIALPALRAQPFRSWRGAGFPALLAVLLVALSGRRAVADARALAEVAQFASYVLLLPLLLQVASVNVNTVLLGICAGELAILCGLWLSAVGAGDWSVATLPENRLIHGVTLAAVIPLALFLLQRVQMPRQRTGLGVLGAVAASVTVSSLPAAGLCVLSLASAARRWCQPRLSGRAITTAGLLALMLTALVLSPDAARRSIARRDGQGRLRRWVQEDIAACRAILAAPFAGHGLGRYQETVSAGQYRRDLPRPSETKVELGMEPGVLVLAVESGLPAALAVLALFAAAGLPRRRQPDADGEPGTAVARHSVLILGAGLFLTLVNARSGGLLCGVLLGLARGQDGPPAAGRGGRALTQAAVVLLALLAMLLCRHLPARPTDALSAPLRPAVPPPDAVTVVLSADTATAVAPGVERVAEPGTASQQVLSVPDLSLESTVPERLASWPFSTPRQARVAVWFRVWWQDGCGNSLAAGIDGALPLLVGNDGTYNAWHWVHGFDADLAAGAHVLALAPREDGIRLDQILVTSATAGPPQGLLGPDGSPLDPAPAPAAEPVAPALAVVPREPPFRVGVGGCYRGGFEAAVLALGLPWSKVNDCDLTRPERLARFDLICLSETTEVDAEPMYRALQGYVENGGILLHENCTGPVPGAYQTNLLFFPTPVRWQLHQAYGGALRTDDSTLFAGLPAGTLYTLRADVPHLLQHGKPGPDWSGRGTLLVYGKDDDAAVWERQLGKGRMIYSRVPFSFHTMWRGPELLPPLKSLLTALTRERCASVAPIPVPEPPAGPQDSLNDDFMREGPDVGPSWTLSGKGACTGERGPEPHTEFSLFLEAGTRAAATQTFAVDWTVSAALRPETGTGGVWLEIAGGELRLVIEKDATVRLDRRSGERRETLGRTPLPGGGGWHRLSLSQRDGTCTAFVDGALALQVAGLQRPSPAGRFGLLCEEGRVFADEVTGRPTAGLLPDSDRYLGDEGSSQAWGGLGQRGIEKSTVYSLQWHTQASATGANAVVLGLPNYLPGTLLCDGAAVAAVGPHADGAVLALPDPTASRRSIGFACAGWRDYVFSARQTDWFCTGADWLPLSRWSCDPNWYWLGAEARGRTALWYRHPLTPPYAVSALVSVGARTTFGEEYTRGRDLNLALGATETDVLSGVAVRVMNAADRGIEVWQDGELVGKIADVGLPSGHSLHHNWFEITAIAEAGRLRVRFEGRDLEAVPLPKPLRPGRTAVWTENNSIRVARVTVSLSQMP
jgi:hypothetical protein